VQGIKALEVLGRVVRVHEAPHQQLGLEQRHPPDNLLLQVAYRCTQNWVSWSFSYKSKKHSETDYFCDIEFRITVILMQTKQV